VLVIFGRKDPDLADDECAALNTEAIGDRPLRVERLLAPRLVDADDGALPDLRSTDVALVRV